VDIDDPQPRAQAINRATMHYETCLITGGTGTFGTAYIIKSIKEHWHKKVIVYSRDEYKQIKLFSFLKECFKEKSISLEAAPYSIKIGDTEIRFFIGDICDYERMCVATRKVDLVIHAAALKHVPICEYNPMEATRTNITGTTNVVNACGINNIKKLIALSTDKAVDPINTYGATKLCLEKVVLGGNRYYPETIMSVVRYGNIIGSRGSIIHKLFTHHGANISLTNPDMTRFWLTIEDAISLVRKSLKYNYSEIPMICVPKLKALRLDKLFTFLRPDLEIELIGPRVGEKTHEKMIAEEDLKKTVYDSENDCYVINMSSENIPFGVPVDMSVYTSDAVAEFTKKEFINELESSIIKDLYGDIT
tara:strand:- start:3321 stop:4409 length:1089 start_codon:yes stop_codon:yes gene_type:complete